MAYLGIILIYIDNDYKLNYKFIGFYELTESHTGIYIYNTFIDILNEYSDLKFKNLLNITRDNASNNDTFIETMKK